MNPARWRIKSITDRLPDLIGYSRPLNVIKIIGLVIVILLLIIVAALIFCIYLRIKKFDIFSS